MVAWRERVRGGRGGCVKQNCEEQGGQVERKRKSGRGEVAKSLLASCVDGARSPYVVFRVSVLEGSRTMGARTA